MAERSDRQPALNVPWAVLGLLLIMGVVEAVMDSISAEQRTELLLWFAFIPARYDPHVLPDIAWPGGWAASLWTFVTYALIHSHFMHFILNAVWLLAFGAPVARRFGAVRFLSFMAFGAAAGAAMHLLTHFGELLPVVGASAAISAAMGAAIRFVFEPGGPLADWRGGGEARFRVPAAPLWASLRDRRVLIFLLVWFGFNALFALGSAGALGMEGTVAWEAHIGGLLAGLLGFSLFDPVAPANASTLEQGP